MSLVSFWGRDDTVYNIFYSEDPYACENLLTSIVRSSQSSCFVTEVTLLLLTLDTAKTIVASIVGGRLDHCNSLLYGVSRRILIGYSVRRMS